jgi:Flp pilus assembly protein TadD
MRPRRERIVRFLVAGALAGLAACASAKPKHDAPTTARIKLARDLVSRADWGAAFAMLDELHRQHPDDAEVLTLRGVVYRERGLFSDAEADLAAAVKAAPASAEAHAALGILYDVQMRAEAEARHREAVRLDPNNPGYLNNLGFSLYLRQQFKPAIAEYEKAARLAPLSRRVRTNLGFAYAASGDLRRAAREFAMGGTEAEAKNNLGFAYERRGEMNNAYDLYLEAVRLDPAAGKARSNLVHAAAVLGRPLPPEAEPPPAAPAPPPPAVPAPPAPSSAAPAPSSATPAPSSATPTRTSLPAASAAANAKPNNEAKP